MDKYPKIEDVNAIVLAGGESRRMGTPKPFLPLGDSTLMDRVISVLHPMFRRVFVVARHPMTMAWPGVLVLQDDRPERGPLVGLARGLAASDSTWCFLVGCDMPFLRGEVIHRMAQHLEGCDILVPRLNGRFQTLHGFYSQRCLPWASGLLDQGVTSLHALLSICKVRTMEADQLLDLDPALHFFIDLDTKEDYQQALDQVQPGTPHILKVSS